MIDVRREEPADVAAIAAIERAAFGRDGEAELVAALRQEARPVLPELQRRGVGSALVRAGLARCGTLGWTALFVLGDPVYYARFGFTLAASRGLRYECPAFDSAFQALELTAGALAGCRGRGRYHAAFDAVSTQ